MTHLRLGEKQRLSTYRKIAIASWKHPRDPSTYSWLDLPVDAAEAFLESYPADVRPTLTHFIARIVADCLERHPHLNHLLRGRNLYRRTRTDIFVTTLLKTRDGLDLSGFLLEDVAKTDLATLAARSKEAADALREGTDLYQRQVADAAAKIPGWLLGPLMRVQMFLQYTLNLSLARFGIPDDHFGSAMISNFGPLGIDNALVPLSPYTRCPLIIGVGRVRPMPVARDGQVVVTDCVTITFTFDHRYADGAHGAQLLRRFQKVFTDPERHRAVFIPPTPSSEA